MSTTGPWRPGGGGGGDGWRGGNDGRRRPGAGGGRQRSGFRVPALPAIPWPGSGGDSTLESPTVRARIQQRIRFAEGAVLVLVGLLLFSFWRYQVLQVQHYREMAENNRRHDQIVRAPRGLITDRDGQLLAANRPAFNVAVVREDVEEIDATLVWLGRILDQPVDELQGRLDRYRGTPAFRPVVIAEDVPRPVVASVEARQQEHPGVVVLPENKRYYPEGTLAAHVLGHVGEITSNQLATAEDGRFRMGDIVGQNGIEQIHDEALAGRAGERQVIVNNLGRVVRVPNEIPPEPGDTLTLTLDRDLQAAAEGLLEERKGSIVVLDTRTGGVLALASAPTFDPNRFAGRFSAGEWEALVNDPDKPLQNRALQSSYPPGSIFKLAMAMAGLQEGAITPDTTVFCSGSGVYYGSRRRCWLAGGHGWVNLRRAIAHSCNIYFYELGQRLGREKIVEIARQAGLGRRTGIDLPSERAGVLPTREWLGATRDGRWYPGETLSIAIGQGAMDATPLQLARMAAIVATGRDVQPHLVERRQDAAARSTPEHWKGQSRPLDIDPGIRRQILEGMRRSVNDNGTGWRARHPELLIGGKTGSAQVASAEAAGPEEDRPEELRNHAWFVGVAPLDEPEIAVSVFLEHGGSGGQDAAPVAGKVFAAWYDLEKRGIQLTEDAAGSAPAPVASSSGGPTDGEGIGGDGPTEPRREGGR